MAEVEEEEQRVCCVRCAAVGGGCVRVAGEERAARLRNARLEAMVDRMQSRWRVCRGEEKARAGWSCSMAFAVIHMRGDWESSVGFFNSTEPAAVQIWGCCSTDDQTAFETPFARATAK